ncbi:MAG: serine/threonine-protein phosphatase [Dehalococcoidia bacterium]|nr:serine/threonine-protein phosphatase [Dehalococcoidia bacterium]
MPELFAARRDTGQRRQTNQDQAVAERLPGGTVVLAVADGVGGMGGGDLASEATIEALLAECRARDGDDPVAILEAAVQAANDRVRELSTHDPAHNGMASTLVAMLIRRPRVWVVNLGDSRAYLYFEGRLRQVTEDDSWVAEQVRAKLLTPEQAKTSPQRNIITRGIGVEAAPQVTPRAFSLVPGSMLLLCSDGLHGVVDEAAIAKILESGPAEEVCKALVDAANAGGGPDNIGVAVYQFAPADDPTEEVTLV